MGEIDLDALGPEDAKLLAHLVTLERRAHKGLVLSPDETLALITRLRAAEARTAWQPIETAPVNRWLTGLHGDRSKPPRVVMRIPTDVAALGFHDEYGNRVRGLTHWQPLPAAPEASHG